MGCSLVTYDRLSIKIGAKCEKNVGCAFSSVFDDSCSF